MILKWFVESSRGGKSRFLSNIFLRFTLPVRIYPAFDTTWRRNLSWAPQCAASRCIPASHNALSGGGIFGPSRFPTPATTCLPPYGGENSCGRPVRRHESLNVVQDKNSGGAALTCSPTAPPERQLHYPKRGQRRRSTCFSLLPAAKH